MSTPSGPSRPSTPALRKPRADAERNRARLLAAACALFEERGDEVQMPDVARAAGVGIGTLYRHFPSRQALVEAAAEQRFAEILRLAQTDCLRDPASGKGLARYLHHVGRVLSEGRGLSASVAATVGSSAPGGEMLAQLELAVGALISQGRAAGTLRADLTVADVYMLVAGLSGIIRTGSGDWHRFIDLAFDGLGPRGDDPASAEPVAQP
ncbi:helix-turn-helix transcriptional regulator [Streptomyces sp. ISL-66]|uniref:TetR/AcrR family transcriptional regulator n=1 Tax=Streptomyces sp. ISL-66 TaxID=2819186 RepID=UPI001BE5F631|nr:TetR/AcrR family transcriptional regulator [Streptomyces sp. ISL-66]MBT2468400.1 helix-turn-helix transcriptional regulator [Streptomyces sp. ISL-66]